MKKIYIIAVTVFWISMMGLLFQKDVLPTFIVTSPAGYEINLTKDYPVRESWMGIYFKGEKIGFSNTIINQDVDDGTAGYRINETTFLKLNIQGACMSVRIRGSSFFSENHSLKNFNYKFISGQHKLAASGYAEGDNLNVTIDINGDKLEKSFKVRQGTLISNSISPILLFKKLDKTKEINLEILDPITFSANRVSIKNIGIENIELNGVCYDAYIFEMDISGIKTRAWITGDGDVLKEESVLGFTMRKENPEQAMYIIRSSSDIGQDLVSQFSLPSNIEILNPRDTYYLRIGKNGSIVEISRSNEPIPENTLSIPIEEIEEEDFIQSGDDRIINLAREIIGNEKNSWEASRKILHWVYGNLKKTPTLSIPSSLDVLRTMQGDCNEHTVLFTALSRSAGIPTKMIAGLVYLDGAFYYHAWPRVYVGEWVNMDPTLGQDIADATHIGLLEGGLKEQIELVKIVGDLKIRVLEYR